MNTGLSIVRKGLFLVAIPLTAQLVFLGVLLIIRSDREQAQQLADHSRMVLVQAEKCGRHLAEAQTNMRGYVLTSGPAFAEEFRRVRVQIAPAFAMLVKLVEDNDDQEERMAALAVQANDYVAWMEENVRLTRSGDQATAVARIRDNGNQKMTAARRGIDLFLSEEARLDQLRSEEVQRVERLQYNAILGGVVLAVVSSVVLLVVFSKSIANRLGVLVANTQLMAQGKELAAPLQGHDELSYLDALFHQMADAIRQKNRENEMFVYSVSHDLRSPLVNLQGFSQELALVAQDLKALFNERTVPAEVRARGSQLIESDIGSYVHFIQTAVTRLAGIIDALLRLSRVGRVEYRWEVVDVDAVVRRVVDALNDTLQRSGAQVELEKLPACWGDATALDQVFGNLIGNAVNYLDPARPGRIVVGCLKPEESPPHQRVYFVSDNGLGIAPAAQAKAFIAFQRLHPGAAPGEGIGLTLVRRIVERHGGQVWLESTVGAGSTFYVALASAEQEQSPPASLLGQALPDSWRLKTDTHRAAPPPQERAAS